MDKVFNLLSIVILTFCLVPFSTGNIHRAVPTRTKGIKIAEDDASLSFFDRVYSRTKEAWVYSLLASLLVGSTGIFPLLIFPSEAGKSLKEGVSPAHLKILLSFAVGGLLGDVFLHLLPEAWMYVKNEDGGHTGHMYIGLWVVAGILAFLIFEKVFGEEGDREGASNEETAKVESGSVDDIKAVTNGDHKASENGHTVKIGYKNVSSNGVDRTPKDATNAYLRNGFNKGECHGNGKSMSNGFKKSNGAGISNGHSATNGHSGSNGYNAKKVDNTRNGDTAHDNEAVTSKAASSEHIQAIGYLNLLANCIDNFTHGLAVAGSFIVGTKVGLCTTFAILLHEIPHEVGDFAILLKSGFRRKDAAIGQIVTASGALFGAMFGLLAEGAGDSSAWVLPFTSGGFIYIAMVTVVPDLIKETDIWETLKQLSALILGVACMGIVSSFHHDHP